MVSVNQFTVGSFPVGKLDIFKNFKPVSCGMGHISRWSMLMM
jgi:hypothetical protein